VWRARWGRKFGDRRRFSQCGAVAAGTVSVGECALTTRRITLNGLSKLRRVGPRDRVGNRISIRAAIFLGPRGALASHERSRAFRSVRALAFIICGGVTPMAINLTDLLGPPVNLGARSLDHQSEDSALKPGVASGRVGRTRPLARQRRGLRCSGCRVEILVDHFITPASRPGPVADILSWCPGSED